MHPTVDEQLAGVRRLLEDVAAAEPLSPRSAAALQDARTILRRLEGSWSAVLPFLDWDNRATATLLTDLGPMVAAPDAAATPPPGDEPTLVVEAAHRRNLELRARLVDAIRALDQPDVDPGEAERERATIAAHLRERLGRDPSHRRPAPAAPTSAPAPDPDPGGGRWPPATPTPASRPATIPASPSRSRWPPWTTT